MANLSPAELLKYDWRIELFLKKYKNKEAFELGTGAKKVFVFVKSTLAQIESRSPAELRKVRLIDSDGNEYPLSALKKNQEFGGKGEGFGTRKEDRELENLREQINQIKAQLASPTIPIKIGSTTYDVFDAASTPGTPKSDFHLTDITGNEIAWLSHKDGSTEKHFQQWGGISARAEPKIFSHREVQDFITDLKQQYPDGLPRATSLYRKIKDTKLKMMSVYGNEYGSKFSRQNVTLMLQGPVKLVKHGKVYEFSANHVHLNGDNMTGGYEPVLAAIYKGDRSDAGVKGTRIVIMPINGRKMTGSI